MIVKSVTNGHDTKAFKAVSLTHVLVIVFGLASIIGAQQTWLFAQAVERSRLVSELRAEITRAIDQHEATSSRVYNLQLAVLEARLATIERSRDAGLH